MALNSEAFLLLSEVLIVRRLKILLKRHLILKTLGLLLQEIVLFRDSDVILWLNRALRIRLRNLTFELRIRAQIRLRLLDINGPLRWRSILLVLYLDLDFLLSVPLHVAGISRE